jgi:hypothetical protein
MPDRCLTWLGSDPGIAPLSVRVRPSSLKRDRDHRTTSTGETCLVNVHHAKSRLTLEPNADTPVRRQGPGGSLPGLDAGHPLHDTGGHEALSMIRNIRGMILAVRGMSDRVQAGSCANSLDRRGGLRSCERACWEPRWEPPGRTTLRKSGLTRTVAQCAAEVTDRSERVRTSAHGTTDQKVRTMQEEV